MINTYLFCISDIFDIFKNKIFNSYRRWSLQITLFLNQKSIDCVVSEWTKICPIILLLQLVSFSVSWLLILHMIMKLNGINRIMYVLCKHTTSQKVISNSISSRLQLSVFPPPVIEPSITHTMMIYITLLIKWGRAGVEFNLYHIY